MNGQVNNFTTNLTPDCPPVTVWEAHKPVIRGVFIKHGARLKREREKQAQTLLREIHLLEMDHKSSKDPGVLSALTTLREQYKSTALFRVKGQLQKYRKHYYINSDKCGRSLARALRAKLTQSYIPEIQDSQGTRTSMPASITSAF